MNRIALGVSFLALLVSGTTALLMLRQRPVRVAQTAGLLKTDLEELSAQVAVLRQQMQALRTGLAVRSVAQAKTGDPAAAPDQLATSLGAISQRLRELEEKASSLQRVGPLLPDELAKLTTAALARGAPVKERVAALRLLRPRNGRADGRTPEVTQAMVELIEAQDTPARLRADIIRQLEWVDHPHLKTPLTKVLSNDPDPESRAEAVETLQSFYADPEVQALVNKVRETDPDPRVRQEAERRMADWKAGRRGE